MTDHTVQSNTRDIVQPKMPTTIPYDKDEIDEPTHKNKICNMSTDIANPLPVALSSNPITNIIDIDIATRGKYKAMGLILYNNKELGDRFQ